MKLQLIDWIHKGNHKLEPIFFGRFQEVIGQVDYKLKLSAETAILDVFHVSLLGQCMLGHKLLLYYRTMSNLTNSLYRLSFIRIWLRKGMLLQSITNAIASETS